MTKCGKSLWARRPTVALSLLLFDPRLRRSATLGPIAILRGGGSQCGGRAPGASAKRISAGFACRLVGRADLEETFRKTPRAREARRWTSSPWVPVLAPNCAA